MKTGEVIDYLNKVFRPELQEDYDNSGFLIGDAGRDYSGTLVSLDLTQAVADEAVAAGLNLIVTHHPLIFGGAKRITSDDSVGRLIMSLIENRIAVYAAHTNLDSLPWGVSAALAERLGLQNYSVLSPGNEGTGFGAIGQLAMAERASLFVSRVKHLLGLPTVRYVGDVQRSVKRVAVCGGSGAFLIGDAVRAGADIYLTADLKYHDFQRAERGMLLCDIGHYESEQFAKEIIFRVVSEKFSNFACRISAVQQSMVGFM